MRASRAIWWWSAKCWTNVPGLQRENFVGRIAEWSKSRLFAWLVVSVSCFRDQFRRESLCHRFPTKSLSCPVLFLFPAVLSRLASGHVVSTAPVFWPTIRSPFAPFARRVVLKRDVRGSTRAKRFISGADTDAASLARVLQLMTRDGMHLFRSCSLPHRDWWQCVCARCRLCWAPVRIHGSSAGLARRFRLLRFACAGACRCSRHVWHFGGLFLLASRQLLVWQFFLLGGGSRDRVAIVADDVCEWDSVTGAL